MGGVSALDSEELRRPQINLLADSSGLFQIASVAAGMNHRRYFLFLLPIGSRLIQEQQTTSSGSLPMFISAYHILCCYRLIYLMHVVCIHVLLQNVPVFSFTAGIVVCGKVSSVCLLGRVLGNKTWNKTCQPLIIFCQTMMLIQGKKQ